LRVGIVFLRVVSYLAERNGNDIVEQPDHRKDEIPDDLLMFFLVMACGHRDEDHFFIEVRYMEAESAVHSVLFPEVKGFIVDHFHDFLDRLIVFHRIKILRFMNNNCNGALPCCIKRTVKWKTQEGSGLFFSLLMAKSTSF